MKCEECNGKGRTECYCTGGGGKKFANEDCPACGGTGICPCPACGGTGKE